MWAWDGKLKRKVGVVEADIQGIRLLWFLKVTQLTPSVDMPVDRTPNPSFLILFLKRAWSWAGQPCW